MDIRDIGRLKGMMGRDCAVDANGEPIGNGDAVIPATYGGLVRREGGNVVLDLSWLRPAFRHPSLRYEVLDSCPGLDRCPGLGGGQLAVEAMAISNVFASLSLIEYFRLDADGPALPFAHGHSGVRCRLWPCGELVLRRSVRLKVSRQSLGDVVVRLPESASRDVIGRHLQRPIGPGETELPLRRFKCWRFIRKVLAGIGQREGWAARCGEPPMVTVDAPGARAPGQCSPAEAFCESLDEAKAAQVICLHPNGRHTECLFRRRPEG